MAERPRVSLVLAALIAAIAIAGVALAPATLFAPELSRVTRGGVRLVDTEGTLWRANAVLATPTARLPVEWRLERWPLLRGEWRIAIGPEGGMPSSSIRGLVARVGDRFSLNDVHATLPAGWLASAAGVDPAWVLGGEVDVNAAAIEWAPPSNHGTAELAWRRARIIVPGAKPLELGDVAAILTADRDSLAGPVQNTGGDLAIRGDIRLSGADGIRVSLVLTPRQADNADLARSLAAFGTADGSGWRVERRFALP